MGQTRVHRILNEVGALAFPGVFDTLSAKIAQPGRLPDGVRLRLLGRGHRHRRAGPGPAHPDRDDRPGAADLHERADPHHRRRRHRLRQPAERPPHRPRADRRRGRRLLPGGPGLAEEVRPHARQAGDRARRLRPEDPGGGRSARGPRLLHRRPHRRPGGRRPRRGDRAAWRRPARPVPTPASSRPRPRCEDLEADRPPLAGSERGQHDRGGPDAGPAAAAARRPGLPADPLPARGPVRRRPRHGGDVPRSSRPTAPRWGKRAG